MKLNCLLRHLTWGTKTKIFQFFEETEKRKKIFSGFSSEAINIESLRNMEVLAINLDFDDKYLEISVTE